MITYLEGENKISINKSENLHQGSLFHLPASAWRKVQSLRLTVSRGSQGSIEVLNNTNARQDGCSNWRKCESRMQESFTSRGEL